MWCKGSVLHQNQQHQQQQSNIEYEGTSEDNDNISDELKKLKKRVKELKKFQAAAIKIGIVMFLCLMFVVKK